MCSADNLSIQSENVVVNLIEDYLKHRESLPLLKEEDPSKDISNLTEEEKEARKTAEEAKKEEEKAAKEKAKK